MDNLIHIRGGGYRAAIDPLRGANCISLSHKDGNRFSLMDDDERKILSEEMHRIILGEA